MVPRRGPRQWYYEVTVRRGTDEFDAIALASYLSMYGLDCCALGGGFPYDDDPALVAVDLEVADLHSALEIVAVAGATVVNVLLFTLDEEPQVDGCEETYTGHFIDVSGDLGFPPVPESRP